MIKLFLYTLFAIVTGLLATLFLAREPGYLLVSFADITFETSLFALFVAVIALLILLRLVVLIIDWINPLRLFRAGRNWSHSRSQRRASIVAPSEQMLRDSLYEDLKTQLAGDAGEVLTLSELRRLWKTRTKKITPDDSLISLYVEVLDHCDATAEGLKILEGALHSGSSDILVRQYSLLGLQLSDASAAAQLQKAESWLQTRPNDAQLLLALGRMSLRNQLWGKAREYFERSLQEKADTEVFAELARLLHSLKEQERSPQFLMKHTQLISHSLPNFPQPT